MLRRALPLALPLALVALLAACGGAAHLSHADYQRTLARELRGLDARIVHAGNSARGAEAIAADLDSAAARLEALHPPSDARTGNADLTAALRAYALDLRDFAVEVRGAPRGRREAQTGLARSAAVRAIQRARADLARAGYSLSP